MFSGNGNKGATDQWQQPWFITYLTIITWYYSKYDCVLSFFKEERFEAVSSSLTTVSNAEGIGEKKSSRIW